MLLYLIPGIFVMGSLFFETFAQESTQTVIDGLSNDNAREGFRETVNEQNSQVTSNGNDWINSTGFWWLYENALHGGAPNNATISSENNVILSPVIQYNVSNISTSFKVNNLQSNVSNYASIVYSFVDPQNFQYGGINILNNSVYAIFYNVTEGQVISNPSWPGNKTDLVYSPGAIFNLSLVNADSKKNLIVNGTNYYSQEMGSENSGYIGLHYGRIASIDFFNFSSQDAGIGSTAIPLDDINAASYPVSDSQTILLDGKTIPENSYIHVYDTTPYQIQNGHIAANLPCNEDNATDVEILVGNAPILNPLQLDYISQLSTPGDNCLYHGNLSSIASPITDIAIGNNSTDEIDFPDTSSIVIHINKISLPNEVHE